MELSMIQAVSHMILNSSIMDLSMISGCKFKHADVKILLWLMACGSAMSPIKCSKCLRCSDEEDGIVDDCSCPFLPFFRAELRWLNCRKGCAATVLTGLQVAFPWPGVFRVLQPGSAGWCDVHPAGVLCCRGHGALVTVRQGALQKEKVWRQCATTEHTPSLCFFLPAAGEHFTFCYSLLVLLMPPYKNYNLIWPARKVKYL